MKRGFLLFFLCLTACSPIVDQRGHATQEDWKTQIIPGQTRREEVLQLMGSPSTTATFGPETWYYISTTIEREAFFKPEVTDRHVIKIAFDPSGIVQSIGRDEDLSPQEFNLVQRTTPTEGHKLGLVEQFIGNLGRFNKPNDSGGPVAKPHH